MPQEIPSPGQFSHTLDSSICSRGEDVRQGFVWTFLKYPICITTTFLESLITIDFKLVEESYIKDNSIKMPYLKAEANYRVAVIHGRPNHSEVCLCRGGRDTPGNSACTPSWWEWTWQHLHGLHTQSAQQVTQDDVLKEWQQCDAKRTLPTTNIILKPT